MGNNCLPGHLISTGQKYVEEWLTENGYTEISKEILQPDDHGYTAKGSRESLLVQVCTFLHPGKPELINDAGTEALISKATSQGLIAYAAYVIVDEESKLVGEIHWDRLSKFY